MANATRIASVLIFLLLTGTVGQAQHRWNAKEKHWYTDWLWWVGEGVIVTAVVLDGHSTALVGDRCPGCREVNPFVGPHPSNRALITYSSIVFGIQTALHVGSWEACPDPNREFKSWRIACDTMIPGISAAFRIPAAVHNYHLASRFPSTQSLSTIKAAQAQFILGFAPPTISRPMTPTIGPSLPPGCDRSLPLCALFRPLSEPKRELR